MESRKNLGFLPQNDAELLAWSINFKTMITGSPETYGLNSAQATDYVLVQNAYAAAYHIAQNPIAVNRPAVAIKTFAKEDLRTASRLLAKIVDGTASVTDAQKLALGLTVHQELTSHCVRAASSKAA